MPTFPTLTTLPIYPVKMEREDQVIKSPTEAGYAHTRSRYSRQRRRWELKYENMPQTDVNTLEAFITTVGGTADSFTWSHPASGQYTVRFEVPPKQEMLYWDNGYHYSYEIVMVEV